MAIKVKDIDALHIHWGDIPVISVYVNDCLVWPLDNNILSCYFNGYWIDEYPWTDDTPWTD